MEDNKDTIKIEPKKSVIRGVFFIIYHLGLIGSIIGVIANLLFGVDTRGYAGNGHGIHFIGNMIAFAIGIHLFASLLYKEYTREDK